MLQAVQRAILGIGCARRGTERNGERRPPSHSAEALDTQDRATWVARILTLFYFLFFLLMPWYTARDKTKPVPERVR